ncbi:MAG: cytochrome d ubiquinol oxidase subunit II [candidate division KSB1 bacterium]|nr:cytochrome d ubiquinol oxidase subunit II [candidate division KSB1 bacterium]
MDLNTIWFTLIAVLFSGFFFLEGFDYGVGVLHLFLAKDDRSRRMLMNSIGPFWDGNEVWIITAGGAMFAAFPHWYATLFSGFYPALVLLLLALIFRGVAFEFRSKVEDTRWRKFWDGAFFFGSLLPALLWGVVLADLIYGVPIDDRMNYVGGFFDLLPPFALLGGLTSLALFTFNGALFLSLKTDGEIRKKAESSALYLWIAALLFFVLFNTAGYLVTDLFKRPTSAPLFTAAAGLAALSAAGLLLLKKRTGFAFALNGIAVVAFVLTVFLGLYPRVMVSSLNAEWSLTAYTASSTPYTLKVMSVVALIFLPIVLAYQAWNFWVFRKRIEHADELEY